MSGTAADIRRARLDADRAQADLRRTIGEIRHRTSPRVIAEQTWDDVRTRTGAVAEDAVEAARDRPALVAGVAGAATLLLFRRPLFRLARRLRGGRGTAEGGEHFTTQDPAPASDGTTAVRT